jgi:hypothetical protein
MKTEKEIEQYLQNVNDRNIGENETKEIKNALKKLKNDYVKAMDFDEAKHIWCFEEIHSYQNLYLSALKKLKDKDYKEAYCDFKYAEGVLGSIRRHYIYEKDKFFLDIIEKHINQFLLIFPYAVGISPEWLFEQDRCSICEKIISLRNNCGHETGEIYFGEMCHTITGKIVAAKGFSLVKEPAQPYSIIHQDNYNFSLLDGVIERLAKPLTKWDIERTTKSYPITDKRFSELKEEDSCPCGSKKSFKECHFGSENIVVPHMIFHIENNRPKPH